MAWADLTADLTAYAGENVKVQLEMVNDAAYYELGFSVDNIRIDGTVRDRRRGRRAGVGAQRASR